MIRLNQEEINKVCGGIDARAVLAAMLVGFLSQGPAGAGIVATRFVLIEGTKKLIILLEQDRIS